MSAWSIVRRLGGIVQGKDYHVKTSTMILLVVAAVACGLVAVLLLVFIQAHPQVGMAILIAVGIIALLALAYAVYYLLDRITTHHHRISTRKLALQAEQDRLERERQTDIRAWEIEQKRLALEMQERQQQWLLEQRRLELEDQKLKLAAYQAQAVALGKDQALVIRDYTGLESRVAYEPRRVQVQVREEQEEVQEAEVVGLLGPATRRPVSAEYLLVTGELDGEDLVLGVDGNGQLVRRTWRQILCVLILGLMGGGKTNTALWIVFQLLLKGYKVALIDRHAKSDESTHARLKDFSSAYDTPVGDSPAAALRVVRHVRKVFESRRDQGASISYQLAFVVDEFTATMRAATDKDSEWQLVAVELAALLEYLNTEGRKYGVYPICMGQAANASRAGGTEIRDLFHTRIIHAMRARQAQMLGLTEEKKAIQKLETGQVYLDIDGKDDPFAMTVPEVTKGFKQAVYTRVYGAQKHHENAVFTGGSRVVQTEQLNLINEPPMNQMQHQIEPRLPELAKRVLDLKNAGMSKNAIVWEIWQVKKGGSEQYKQANAEYTQIIESLTELGYLQAQQ